MLPCRHSDRIRVPFDEPVSILQMWLFEHVPERGCLSPAPVRPRSAGSDCRLSHLQSCYRLLVLCQSATIDRF